MKRISKVIILAVLLVTAISCDQEQVTTKYLEYKVEGVDRQGNSRVCFNDPDTTCHTSALADIDEEEFASRCTDSGNVAHKCGCNEYICEEKTFKGFDIEGKERSCKPMASDIACTLEFTDEDQFAVECEDNGNEVIQCGCHDYICLKTNDAEEEDKVIDSEEVLGTNQDGVRRSCISQTSSEAVICPTVINSANVYAQNCKEDGFEVVWCSCNEVLCID